MNIISVNDWKSRGETAGAACRIIDVCSANEFASGHLPGAINIPLEQLAYEPRIVSFQYDYGQKEITDPGTIGDEAQGYANLSPFTLWTIDFGLAGNEWLDLTKIQTIEISFDGNWQVESRAKRAQRAAS